MEDSVENKDFIENLTASLVREYLSRKGLKSVLHVLEQELPRHKNSINNRGTLIQVLHLEKSVKRNKVSLHPLRTLLEIILKDLIAKCQQYKVLTTELENVTANCKNPYVTAPNVCSSVHTLSTKANEDGNKIQDVINLNEEIKNDLVAAPSSPLLRSEQKPGSKFNYELIVNSEDKSDHNVLPKVRPTNEVLNISEEIVATSKNQNLLKENDLLKHRNKNKEIFDNLQRHKCGFGPVSSTNNNPRERRRLQSNNSLQSNKLVHLSMQSKKEEDVSSLASKERCSQTVLKSSHNEKSLFDTNILFPNHMSSDENQLPFLSKVKVENNGKFKKKKETTKLVKEVQDDIELSNLSDVDDLDVCDLNTHQHISSQMIPDYSCIRPITIEEACELKMILFGSPAECFGREWTKQGFTFCHLPSLSYGIIQEKAGPCGVLAAVQAHVLCELLFGTMENCLQSGCLRPKKEDLNKALCKAFATILWQAGENTQAIFAVNTKRKVLDVDDFRISFKSDGILDCLVLQVFNSYDVLLKFLNDIIPKLEDEGSCVTFLYSAVLTRGLERMKRDMDHPNSHLIGQYGYCSQEIVNLLLIGQAVSNVFDGDVELNTGGKEKTILHGIPRSSRIGLLSLYEYQNTCEVGSYYKNPLFPIWIISGESHFSVLFATSQDVMHTEIREPFCLFYFDGLANQDKEVCLTVDTSAGHQLPPRNEDDYLPPVERCIHTRWKGSSVNWNGTNLEF